jgi:hypothetical protein
VKLLLVELSHLIYYNSSARLISNLLCCRSLGNKQHVVIAVVIVFHPRFQRKRSKMQQSSYFVGTVKRYVSGA